VYSLPFLEQDNLFKQINPRFDVFNSVGVWSSANGWFDRWQANWARAPKPPYLRCPSDGFERENAWSNYASSIGPQCAIGPCGYDPNQAWCQPETSGAGGGLPNMGYTWSPDHGNSFSSSDIRGMFNRLGAEINMASVTDGLSNTIMVGETLPAQHDHFTNVAWWHFNGAGVGASTIVPINYKSDQGATWCSPANQYRGNWNIAWGFKSNHSGGTNFLFGDGSVRFTRQTIDHRTYQLLGCRNDGKAVDLP